jgi:hypothetical protein
MRNKNLSRLTISINLTTLAISDTIVLIFDCLIISIDLLNTNFDIKKMTDCKIYYPQYVARLVSAWIVVSISFDRFLSVYFPQSTKKMLNSSKSCIKRVILIIFLSSIINLHYLIIIKAPEDSISVCIVIKYGINELWYENTWQVLYTILHSIVPSILLITSNILIIHKSAKSKSNLNCGRLNTINEHQKKTTKMNITVFTICFSFVILTLPANIYVIATFRDLSIFDDYAEEVENFEYLLKRNNLLSLLLTRRVLEQLMNFNHAINFFLYVLTSNLFRREFIIKLKHQFRLSDNKVLPISSVVKTAI